MNNKRVINKLILTFISGIFLFSLIGCQSKTSGAAKPKSNDTATATKTKVQQVSSNNTEPSIKLTKAVVTKCLGGDIVYVQLDNGTKAQVKFIGDNIPKNKVNNKLYEKQSNNYIRSQLVGKTVYLEKDVSETDKNGKLLRYIWLQQPKEINETEIRSKMFNSMLILNGYDEQVTVSPDVKYDTYLKKFCSEAKNGHKGIWAVSNNSTAKVNKSKTKSLKGHAVKENTNKNM